MPRGPITTPTAQLSKLQRGLLEWIATEQAHNAAQWGGVALWGAKDAAQALGVSVPSVSRALRSLERRGLVGCKRSGGAVLCLWLTPEGQVCISDAGKPTINEEA